MTGPKTTLYLFFARENDRAVILRRGPTKQCRMILWHRDTDRFEDGQWIKQKVYPERCHLSPDGAHFMFFALDGHWSARTGGTYNAISLPPYWTALALFPVGDTWTMGGAFVDNVHYHVPGGSDIVGRAEGLHRVELGAPGKGCSTGIRLMSGARAPLDRATTRRLLEAPEPQKPWDYLPWMRGSDHPELAHYTTQDGKLFRRKADGALDLIRDFTDMAFEPVRAPYDWRQEGIEDRAEPWHPLDEDGS